MVVLQRPDYEGVDAPRSNYFVVGAERQTPHSAVLMSVQFILKLKAIYIPNLDKTILASCSQNCAARVALRAPLERRDRALKRVEKLYGRGLVLLPETHKVV